MKPILIGDTPAVNTEFHNWEWTRFSTSVLNALKRERVYAHDIFNELNMEKAIEFVSGNMANPQKTKPLLCAISKWVFSSNFQEALMNPNYLLED